MRLSFTDELFFFLEFAANESIVAQVILSGDSSHIKEEGNFVSVSDSEYLSYLPISKMGKVDSPWTQCRTKIKVGRFIRKFFTEFTFLNFGINDPQIEKFVNLYKCYFSKDATKLSVVEGDDIKKYYLEENYHSANGLKRGSLWNSCMRQKERNKFLSLYSKNSESIKMLVYFDDNGKVRARALLWQKVIDYNSDNVYKVMDRIYSVYDHDVEFFKDWASENGYLTKWQQNAKSELYFDSNTKVKQMELYVDLPIHNLSYAPYLDTFKFYNYHKGRFTNTPRFSYNYILVQSDGTYEREPVDPEPDWIEEN